MTLVVFISLQYNQLCNRKKFEFPTPARRCENRVKRLTTFWEEIFWKMNEERCEKQCFPKEWQFLTSSVFQIDLSIFQEHSSDKARIFEIFRKSTGGKDIISWEGFYSIEWHVVWNNQKLNIFLRFFFSEGGSFLWNKAVKSHHKKGVIFVRLGRQIRRWLKK